jgi:hypothetical protein
MRRAALAFGALHLLGCGGRSDLAGTGGAPGASASSAAEASSSSSSGAGGSGGAPASCIPGESAACYEGPPGTAGVGICQPGAKVCAPDGSGFGPCLGQTLPAPEDCASAFDEDCDGVVSSCPVSYLFTIGPGAYLLGMTVDPSGDAYVAGVTVGPTMAGALPIGFPGHVGIFVAHLDPAGQLAWLREVPSTGTIASAHGSLVRVGAGLRLTGATNGVVDFAPGSFTGEKAFVVGLDAEGHPLWQIGSPATAMLAAPGPAGGTYGVAFDDCWNPDDGCFLGVDSYVGDYTDGVFLGGDFSITPPGAGQLVAYAAGSDSAGNLVLAGASSGGSTTPQSLFVGAFAWTGDVLWSHAFAGTADPSGALSTRYPLDFSAALGAAEHASALRQTAFALAVGPDDSVAVAAVATGPIDFGGGPLDAPGDTLLLARFDATGHLLWSRSLGGPVESGPPALAFTPAGHLLVLAGMPTATTGLPPGALDFGGGPLTGKTVLARLDGAGNLLGQAVVPAVDLDSFPAIAWAAGSTFVAGTFAGALDFSADPATGFAVMRIPGP